MNNKLSPAARREENWGWIMVAPTILGLVILNLWPFVQTIFFLPLVCAPAAVTMVWRFIFNG